jgi:hypothetical protein
MNTYRVTAVSIDIHSGILRLDPSQADKRIHRLKPLGGNRYDVSDPPVTFKRGEVFGLDGALPKGMGQDVEEAEAPAVGSDFVPPPRKSKR